MVSDLILLFVVLPIGILWDSWKRLGRVGWEWSVFGYASMSVFGAVLIRLGFDVLWSSPPQAGFFTLSRGILLGGVIAFDMLYQSIEQPVLKEGRKWLLPRAAVAGFLGIVLSSFMADKAPALGFARVDSEYHLRTALLVAGMIGFALTQIKLYGLRDGERIAAYRKRREQQKAPRTNVLAQAETGDSTDSAPMKCPNCGATYRETDYRSDATLWKCSECKEPLPRT